MGIRKYGDQMGRAGLGTICPGGPNVMGTVCPGGPNFGEPFIQGDRKWGTGSPGTKWVRNKISCSRSEVIPSVPLSSKRSYKSSNSL